MTPAFFPALLADLTLQGLLGSDPMRAWPFGNAPQKPAYPYAVWQVISGAPENYLDKTPDVDNLSVQFDVYADDATADVVAKAIRDALEPLGHMTRIGAQARDAKTMKYRMSFDFDFWTDR